MIVNFSLNLLTKIALKFKRVSQVFSSFNSCTSWLTNALEANFGRDESSGGRASKGLFIAVQALNDSKLDVSCVSSYFSTGELFSCELHTRDSFSGNFIADFYLGVDAVLGPANITKDDQIPIEQCINTCKLRPGSGCLGVKIFADGPTRVLQITDCLQQVRFKALYGYAAAIQRYFFLFFLAMHFMCMAYALVLGYQSDFFLVVRLFILLGFASDYKCRNLKTFREEI